MKLISIILFIFTLVSIGCADSHSTAIVTDGNTEVMVTANGRAVIANNQRTEIVPNTTEVKIIYCAGMYMFDGELCNNVWAREHRAGKDIQAVVAERYSHYNILKIERTREVIYSWEAPKTVYYVTLNRK